jgi:hypothetical protein
MCATSAASPRGRRGCTNVCTGTGIVCSLRYRRHDFCAEGIHSESVKKAFLAHADQEPAHALKRIGS